MARRVWRVTSQSVREVLINAVSCAKRGWPGEMWVRRILCHSSAMALDVGGRRSLGQARCSQGMINQWFLSTLGIREHSRHQRRVRTAHGCPECSPIRHALINAVPNEACLRAGRSLLHPCAGIRASDRQAPKRVQLPGDRLPGGPPGRADVAIGKNPLAGGSA